MPYQIEISKDGNKKCYSVVNKITGTIHSKCATKKKAESQLRLLLRSERNRLEQRGSGEKHAILYTGNGNLLGFEKASYMGPGTNLKQRLIQNSKPKTYSDKVSQAHDLRYTLATSGDDIRKADEKMLKLLEKAKKEKLDYKFNILQGEIGIKSKIFLEDRLGIAKERFTDFGIENIPKEDLNLYTTKLNELQLQGFGAKRPIGIKVLKCKF